MLQLPHQTKDRDDPVTLDDANSRTVCVKYMELEGVDVEACQTSTVN